jgi:hypothetical protein
MRDGQACLSDRNALYFVGETVYELKHCCFSLMITSVCSWQENSSDGLERNRQGQHFFTFDVKWGIWFGLCSHHAIANKMYEKVWII